MTLVNFLIVLSVLVLLLDCVIVVLGILVRFSFVPFEAKRWCFYWREIFLVVKNVMLIVILVLRIFVFWGF